MATTHREDHPKAEQGQLKDRPMTVQPEQGVRIDDVRKAQVDRPHSFLDEPVDPRTGLRGRPESPSDNPGQKTRDNVTPVIPSAPPREGGIVDPTSLGMEQGGVPAIHPPPVKSVNEPGAPAEQAVDPDNLPPGHFNASVNEPPGSNVGGETTPPAPELPELVLTSVTPDTAVIGVDPDVALTIAGSGFDASCVVVFGDEDIPTTFVSDTELTAVAPMATVAEIVDVEVSRGDETSDVLTFEWTAVAGRRTAEKSERKPKKATPASKRPKKGKR